MIADLNPANHFVDGRPDLIDGMRKQVAVLARDTFNIAAKCMRPVDLAVARVADIAIDVTFAGNHWDAAVRCHAISALFNLGAVAFTGNPVHVGIAVANSVAIVASIHDLRREISEAYSPGY